MYQVRWYGEAGAPLLSNVWTELPELFATSKVEGALRAWNRWWRCATNEERATYLDELSLPDVLRKVNPFRVTPAAGT